MKLFLDIKYINLLSSQLRNFKQKDKNLYNFSCPICGDSKKDKTKARGYFYIRSGIALFHCHNCNASSSFKNFLKSVNPLLHNEYCFDKYKNNPEKEKFIPEKKNYPVISKNNIGIPNVIELGDNHEVIKYIKSRKIPLSKYKHLYYAENFTSWISEKFPDRNYDNIPNDSRIVIPYFNRENELIGAQGRTIDKKQKIRYVSVKRNDTDHFIFGQNSWNIAQVSFVTEGPIDSLFLENCLAVSCSDIAGSFSKYIHDNSIRLDSRKIICIFDNEPRNKEIVKMMTKCINLGFRCVIWKNTFTEEKDINDMILSGKTRKEVVEYVLKNSYSGLTLELEINNWKK
jgi:transcription elongation factor Elf1/phage anti-repressor protein